MSAVEYMRACAVADVPEAGTHPVELNGVPLVIVKSEGEIYALDEFCTHEDVSLADGEVYDQTVECWLHGSCFDLRSGKPTGPPATRPLTTYQVRIDDGDVFVGLPSNAQSA
jgi:3-phenylpropionate/trans-cinnamate dioxygenase ferredoxin component